MARRRQEDSERSREIPSKPDAAGGEALVSSRASGVADRLVGVLLVLATFLLCVFPLMDTDFWWHLRTGQLIWERGEIPRTDWYLFTDFDKPWIDLHWGFQLLVAALYKLGGVNLVILTKATVIAAAVAVVWSAAGSELPAWLRALIWMPAVICITGRGYERPEMLSQLFLAMWLWIAFRVETDAKWIWALPAIQVVWINCHALFVLGLVVGGCFAVDYFLRALAHGRLGLAPPSPTLKPTSVLGAGSACALAAFVNPYLVDGAMFPLVLYRKFSVEQEFYSTRIGEFQSPLKFLLVNGLTNIYLNTQIQLGVIAIASFVALLAFCVRWSPFRLLLFVGFLHLGWEASRNVNIFAIVTATVTAANLAELWRMWPSVVGGRARLNERRREGEKERLRDIDGATAFDAPPLLRSVRLSGRLNTIVCALLVAWMGLTVTGVWGAFAGEKKLFGFGQRPWWFAHEAVEFAGQMGFPDRAFVAHIGIAATYEFHHGPKKKVFMDPRLEVATQQTFRRWEQILEQMASGDRSWETLLKDSDGNLPVVILDSRVSRPAINGLLQTRGWRLVHADPAAAVFLSEHQASELNLPIADPRPLMFPP